MKDCIELIKSCPYITMDEHYFMKQLAAQLPTDQIVVMIGAGPGEFLLSFLEGYRYPSAKCTVIDKETCYYTEKHILGDHLIDDSYAYSVKYIVDNSINVGHSWNSLVDLLIVDGDHTAKGVQQDIQAWARHVRKYIWFHDYTGPDSSVEARQIIDAYATLADWCTVGTPGYSKVFKVLK